MRTTVVAVTLCPLSSGVTSATTRKSRWAPSNPDHPLQRRAHDGKDPNPLGPCWWPTLEPEWRDREVAQHEEAIYPPRPPLYHPSRRLKRVERFGDMDGVGVGEVGAGQRGIAGDGGNATSIDGDPPHRRGNVDCTLLHMHWQCTSAIAVLRF